MGIPFNDIDPYEVLEVSKTATPIEIKKSYKKLCLKYHPDKLAQSNQDVDQDNEIFPKLQFAYSILSDSSKRQRYDNTGSLSESADLDDSDFSWKDFFDSINEGITIDMIEEDKLIYQGSNEEKMDILQNFTFYDGDFLKIFECIPHLEFDEQQEERVFHIVEEGLNSGEIELDKVGERTWNKYVKSRKTKVKQMLKKLSKEAKEAAELEKKIRNEHGNRRGSKKSIVGGSESDLKSLIQSRRNDRFEGLIEKLESKYGASKKGKKRKGGDDIDDEEFERIQRGLKRK
ncbi:hypothetical protein CLIB1423_11S01068 [[Candida] railenensis]|uniref:J domain-containing protein n=1 Tax=[Candida] railenensis TaxID=45579 RepID=A0A9P0VZ13_9ASCO|nr:hypothetical protein CLIB1423_11S01068 [[Candida] railenensis]